MMTHLLTLIFALIAEAPDRMELTPIELGMEETRLAKEIAKELELVQWLSSEEGELFLPYLQPPQEEKEPLILDEAEEVAFIESEVLNPSITVQEELGTECALTLQGALCLDEVPEEINPSFEDLTHLLEQPHVTLATQQNGSKDLYETLPISIEEKQKIGKILTTMAENSVFKLLFEKKYLERLGRDVNHVHPLRFIGTVFQDPRLVYCMFQIRRSGFKWDGFIDGFRDRLHEEIDAKNVEKYLAGLAKALNVNAEDLLAYVRYRDAEGLVLYLMEKSRRS